jgi:hypothetical protein
VKSVVDKINIVIDEEDIVGNGDGHADSSVRHDEEESG